MNTSLNWSKTALLIVDPQIDTLSPEGAGWDLFGEQITKRGLIANLVALRDAANEAGAPLFYSHIAVTEQDYSAWTARNGLQQLMAQRKLLSGVGGEFLPELAPTDNTVLLSGRKGPSPNHSDMAVQMRQRGIETIVFAGMVANLCVESHVREATDSGFNAIVVGDAIATLSDAAHEATLANFQLLASEVVNTTDILASLSEPVTA